ncbi:MAG: cytochrome c [Bacteriovoracaceae bacterium]|nr:cytochrome c [Bacteriovoracaceae bacterium]
MTKVRTLLSAALVVVLFTPLTAFPFDAPEYFENKCLSCHSIGGGDEVGPDLKGVGEKRSEKWLIEFIRDSEKVISSGDPVANELFAKFKYKKMPAQELTDAQIKSLLEFIKTGKGGGASSYRAATEANTFDVSKGHDLFIGTAKFKNGGPSCLSCHSGGPNLTSFGGGTLGPDLVTKSYADYQDKGLNKVLSKISFPTMAEIYTASPLTEEENYYLRAFLRVENLKYQQTINEAHHNGDPKNKFVLLGMVGALSGLLGADAIFRKRRKKTKKPY